MINEINAGIGLGQVNVDYSRNVFGFTNIFGYEFSRQLLAGIGTGVNFYNGGTMIPLYIDMRYSFGKKKTEPFFSADGGMLFTLSDIKPTGIFINPSFGIHRHLSSKLSFYVSGGYLLQEAPSGMRNSYVVIKGGMGFTGKR